LASGGGQRLGAGMPDGPRPTIVAGADHGLRQAGMVHGDWGL